MLSDRVYIRVANSSRRNAFRQSSLSTRGTRLSRRCKRRNELVTNLRETPSFEWRIRAAKRTFAAAFRAKTLDHRRVACTLHVAESFSCARTSLEDSPSPLLPGAHETRNANVRSSCVRDAEHEKPLRPARLGCVCRDDPLVSLFFSSSPPSHRPCLPDVLGFACATMAKD